MVDRRIFTEKFEPVVQPHEFIQTFPKLHYYQILAIYPLPLLSVDICDANHLGVGLVAAVESGETELDDVYLDDKELAQMRWIPRENFQITWMAKPKAREFYTTKNQRWVLPTYYDDPRTNPANEYLMLHDIFQFEDTGFWIRATSVANLAAAHLDFFGYRFILREIKVIEVPKGLRPTVVNTEGWPGTVETEKETPTSP